MKNVRKYTVLLGSVISSFSVCFVLYFGNVSTYIYSMQRSRAAKSSSSYSFDIDVSWMIPIYFACRFAGTYVVDRSSRTFGTKRTFTCGAILSVVSVFVTYFSVSHSVWATALTLTIIGGMGNHSVTMCHYIFIAGWFREKTALASSMTHLASALGGFVINLVLTSYINPDNLSPDATTGAISYFSQPAIIDRIPMAFVLIGCLSAGCQFVGFCLVKEAPGSIESEEESPLLKVEQSDLRDSTVEVYNNSEDIKKTDPKTENPHSSLLSCSFHNSDKRIDIRVGNVKEVGDDDVSHCETFQANQEHGDFTPLQMLKSPVFYFLQSAFLSQAFGLLVVENYFKVFGLTEISDDQFLALVGSAMSFSIIVTTPFFGYIMDQLGMKNTIVAILATDAVFMSLWYFTVRPSKWLYMFWAAILFLGNYSQGLLMPMSALKLFGKSHYAANFALMQLTALIASFIGTPVIVTLLSSLGWFWLFFITATLACLSTVLLLFNMPSDRSLSRGSRPN